MEELITFTNLKDFVMTGFVLGLLAVLWKQGILKIGKNGKKNGYDSVQSELKIIKENHFHALEKKIDQNTGKIDELLRASDKKIVLLENIRDLLKK